jgi:hypothetical protein
MSAAVGHEQIREAGRARTVVRGLRGRLGIILACASIVATATGCLPGTTAGGGYTSSGAYPSGAYVVRVSSDASQFLPYLTPAVRDVAQITGLNVTMGPTLDSGALPNGEIEVIMGPCPSLYALACTARRVSSTDARRITGATVHLTAGTMSNPANILRHELGRAFGLAIYDGTYQGSLQVMHTNPITGITTYQAGDVAGLRSQASTGRLLFG